MAAEEPKVAQQATTQEQQPPQLPPGVVYPYNGAPYPHGTPAYPPFYSYPPPAEGQATENSAPPPPPPGFMMFPHPPPPGLTPPQPQPAPAAAPAVSATAAAASSVPPMVKPKRKQVKMACTNCAAACKRCDEHRPCERCTKYGITDTCVDGQRKERKKGIKRGPYKRKNKDGTSEGEWSAGTAPPPANPPPPQQVPVIQAIPHQFPNGEAFYPIYYPPGVAPYLAVPPPHDGEGAPNGQPPLIPYYIPGGYPHPFAHYSPFAMPPPPPAPPAQQQAGAAQSPPQTVDPAVTSSSTTEPSKESPSPLAEKTATNGVHTAEDANDVAAGKKRKKSGDKSKKSKKAKTSKEATTVNPSALSVAADEDAEEA